MLSYIDGKSVKRIKSEISRCVRIKSSNRNGKKGLFCLFFLTPIVTTSNFFLDPTQLLRTVLKKREEEKR